jgi:hypothetical protein
VTIPSPSTASPPSGRGPVLMSYGMGTESSAILLPRGRLPPLGSFAAWTGSTRRARQGAITAEEPSCSAQVDCPSVMTLPRGTLVISSLTEFEESTAFERWTLEALVPLPARRPHQLVKDVAANHVWITLGDAATVRVYAGGVQEVHVDLRPLAFGAAWKVLDLLLELAYANAGTPAGGGWLTIAKKENLARQGHGALVPLTADRALWRTLTSTYAATTQARHSLVHRLAEVDQATGTLIGRDDSGLPLVPITADQQEAFCRAVQRAAMAALAGQISRRERSDLAGQLDQLQAHHQQPALGGIQFQPPALLLAPASLSSSQLVIDIPALIQAAQSSWPDRKQIDATFSLPDGRNFLAEADTAPASVVTVDPDNPPDWLQEWEGWARPGTAGQPASVNTPRSSQWAWWGQLDRSIRLAWAWACRSARSACRWVGRLARSALSR